MAQNIFTKSLLKSSLLVFALLFAPTGAAETESFKSSRLRDLTLKTKIPLVDLDVNEWTRVEGDYRIQISPNQDRNSYSRREQFDFRFQLQDAINTRMGAGGRTSITAEFIRQFPSQSAALSIAGESRPYKPTQAPHSAKKALALKSGDYYSAEMRAAFEINATTAELNGLAFGGLEAKYIVSGDFKLEVYRRKGSKVFVRASSLKEKSTRVRLFAESRYEFDVFGFDPANNFLDSRLNVTLFELDLYNRGSGKLFTVEYEYDLSSAKARQAYEKLMNPKQWKWTDLAVINPARAGRSETVRKILTGKIEASDNLSRQGNAGVRRDSQSETDFTRDTSGLRLNLLAGSTRRTRNYLEQDFQFQLGEERSDYQRYKIATLSLNRKYDILLGWRERDLLKEATIIFELDRQREIAGFEELSFTYQRSDVRLKSSSCPLLNLSDRVQLFNFCQNELPAIFGQFRKMLPESWHARLDLENIFAPVVGRPTFLDLDLVFSPKALEVMQLLNRSEIEQELIAFTDRVRETTRNPENKFYYGELEYAAALRQNSNDGGANEEAFYRRHIADIVDGLELVLTRTKDKRVILGQWQELVRLQNNPLFRELGSGMMVRLLERAARKPGTPSFASLVYFNVQLNARGLEPVSRKVGDYERPDYMALLIRTRNSLLNRTFDPVYFKE